MDNKEYLKKLIEKFNTNPADESLSQTERLLLAKVSEAEKKFASLVDQATELEKEINTKTQSLMDLRNYMVKEKGRSEAFIESILALR